MCAAPAVSFYVSLLRLLCILGVCLVVWIFAFNWKADTLGLFIIIVIISTFIIMVSLRSRTAKAASQKKGTNSETSDKTANGSGGVTNINNGSKSNTNGVVEVEKQLPPTLSRRGLILARIGIVLCVIGMIVAAIGVAAIASK